ncbi:MAG TPA: 2-C-methyl-D-erythritol 2,4-cyclodiphosphate synthase [Candidatus Obscuribacterales bacterium]
MRIGNGFDIHRLVPGRPLVLGGVEIQYECGLEGHSDGDAVAHAIADSILGAAGLGDIGLWFPSDDEFYRGVNSIELLKKVVKSAKEHGYKIGNVDCVIICERPRLSPHYPAMRKVLAEALEVTEDRVSLKARTMERLGAIGRGEAIAVECVVLLD